VSTDWTFSLYRNERAAARGSYPFADVLSAAEARCAHEEIRRWPRYAPTPLLNLQEAAARAGVRRVFYKNEAPRFGLGSFKALGGAYAVAQLLQSRLGHDLHRRVEAQELMSGAHRDITSRITVACASDGNHGRSVAAGAKLFGCACIVFLHEGVSRGRESAIIDLGASVVRTAGNYDDSVRAARNACEVQGLYLVSDTADDPAEPTPLKVMRGYATLVIETLEQLRADGEASPSHVFLQGGVGGLAAAVIAYLWETQGQNQTPTFVIVEPRRADCLYQSAACGRPTPAKGDLQTLMAGLACGEVSRVAWPILWSGAEFFLAVEDSAAVECMRLLYQGALGGASLVAGESGVAGLAGLLAVVNDPTDRARALLRLDSTSTVLLIGTEGATDPEIFRNLVGS
jgi:diaminopropionate ammonia-lyase